MDINGGVRSESKGILLAVHSWTPQHYQTHSYHKQLEGDN